MHPEHAEPGRRPAAVAASTASLRRVVAAVLLALLLLAALPVLVPGSSPATAAPDLVVAVEEISEDVGPDVRGPNDESNLFAPTDLEANYLWGANWGLLVLIALPFGLMGLLYWLKVGRYQRAER